MMILVSVFNSRCPLILWKLYQDDVERYEKDWYIKIFMISKSNKATNWVIEWQTPALALY